MKTGRKQGTEILTLIFDAGLWSRTDAVEFAGANGFKFGELIENEGEILLPQKAIETFAAGAFPDGATFREVHIAAGLSALVGFALNEELGDVAAGDQAAHRPSDCSMNQVFRNGRCVPKAAKEKSEGSKKVGSLRSKSAVFFKIDEEKRLVTGPALVPNVVDSQGDFEFKEDIEAAAHLYLEQFRGIDDMHQVFKDIRVPVESWILREDTPAGKGNMLPAGTWMLTTRVTNDGAWARVKSGELTGYSIVYQGIHEGVHG